MNLHPRTMIVQAADIDVATAICDAVVKHKLTGSELIQILANQIMQWNKYAIRDEREREES